MLYNKKQKITISAYKYVGILLYGNLFHTIMNMYYDKNNKNTK